MNEKHLLIVYKVIIENYEKQLAELSEKAGDNIEWAEETLKALSDFHKKRDAVKGILAARDFLKREREKGESYNNETGREGNSR